MKYKKIIVLFIIASILITICLVFFINHSKFPNSAEAQLLGVTLEVKAPFSTAKLVISEDGSAQYTAQKRGQPAFSEEYPAGTFSKQILQELQNNIQENNFFNLPNTSQEIDNPTDGSNYTITVSIRPKGPPELVDSLVHTVTCYEFTCDQRFLKIKQTITNAFGKDMLEVGV